MCPPPHCQLLFLSCAQRLERGWLRGQREKREGHGEKDLWRREWLAGVFFLFFFFSWREEMDGVGDMEPWLPPPPNPTPTLSLCFMADEVFLREWLEKDGTVWERGVRVLQPEYVQRSECARLERWSAREKKQTGVVSGGWVKVREVTVWDKENGVHRRRRRRRKKHTSKFAKKILIAVWF